LHVTLRNTEPVCMNVIQFLQELRRHPPPCMRKSGIFASSCFTNEIIFNPSRSLISFAKLSSITAQTPTSKRGASLPLILAAYISNVLQRYSCKTALHIAAKKGYIRCAEVLLELGGACTITLTLESSTVTVVAGSLRCFDHARRPPHHLARSPDIVAVFAPYVIQMREQVSFRIERHHRIMPNF
jgi:hypothetical protein